MALTQIQAKDEMFTMFRTAWNANSVAVITPYQITVPYVSYHGVRVKFEDAHPSNKYSAILDMFVGKRNQSTLAINVVNMGNRMYNNKGILRLQILCPLADAENSDRGLRLGYVALDAFEGKRSPCGVHFYDGMVEPSISNEVFSKHIMTVKYEYDHIK